MSYTSSYVGLRVDMHWWLILRPVWKCRYACKLTFLCMYGCIHVVMHVLIYLYACSHALTCVAAYIRPVWLCRYACKLTYMFLHGCIHAVMHALIHLYWRVWYCTSSFIYYAECMSAHYCIPYGIVTICIYTWGMYHDNMHMCTVISILRYTIIVLISACRILCIKSYWRIVVSHNVVHMVSHIKVCLFYWMFYASLSVMRKFV